MEDEVVAEGLDTGDGGELTVGKVEACAEPVAQAADGLAKEEREEPSAFAEDASQDSGNREDKLAVRHIVADACGDQGTATTASVCAYSTTKAAILSFTRTLAVDLGPKGVRSNSLSPGSIITPMQEYFADMTAKEGQSREDVYKQFAEPVPIGRLGDVAETAELACFLASERAGFCNRGEYVADGGLLAGLRLY